MANVLADLFQDIADAIRAKTGSTDKMAPASFPDEIGAISAGSGDVSGVNAALDAINGELIGAKTVTFMVEGKVYATRQVAPGDTSGKPSNPTKASSVAEDFSFAGWSLEDDGTVDSAALRNVTEDRTVYAVFTATPRQYTVRFFDDDGTALHSEKVEYGKSSTYTATKKGALFQSWDPAPVGITGDLDCYAVWHYVTFANDDWATIKTVAQTHNAGTVYSQGDERELVLNYADGTTETALLEVDEFNPGVGLVDAAGNDIGTAGMTIRLKTALATPQPFLAASWTAGQEVSYLASPIYAYLHDTVIPAMPAELQAVLSAAWHEYDASTGKNYSTETREGTAKLWILTESDARSMQNAGTLDKTVYGTDTPVSWWLRDLGSYSGFPYSVLCGENVDSFINSMATSEDGAKTPYHIVFEFYL